MDPLEYLVPGRKRLPYGMMNFAVIRREDYYYVDNYGAGDTAKQVYIPCGTYELTVPGSQ